LILENHIVLMFLYAVIVGIFFALLWRRAKRERIKLFILIFVSLFVGAIVLGWLMYPFPEILK
jgi:uncharacterized membrane protein YfcA